MENCPFCLPDISDIAFAESLHSYAIYNKAPILPGHAMIITKAHYQSLLEVPADLRAELMELSVQAVHMLMKTFQATAFNWTLQDGKPAGQTVMHLHLHLIPRFQGDLPDPGDWYPMLEKHDQDNYIDSQERRQYSKQQLIAIARRIRATNT